MSGQTTFEQLCTGSKGYACDESSMARLHKEETFNDLVFKLVTKCETDLLYLPSPSCTVSQFCVDIIPVSNNNNKSSKSSLTSAWQSCENKGFDGLHVVASLDPNNVPKNGSGSVYTFAQFADSVIRSIEIYFMFQKHNAKFALNALNLWGDPMPVDQSLKSCYVAFAWKFDRQPVQASDLLSRTPPTQVAEDRRKSLPAKKARPATTSTRGRRSLAPPVADISTDEEDPEISFRKKPKDIIPKGMSPSPSKTANGKQEEMDVDPIAAEDITFGFEKTQPTKGGRKSTARKSLLPDWPEDDKEDVLFFFDNLNPSQTEQTCIALTCKYASMQYDRELPSKLLYQWVQKKGRQVSKTINNYEIPDKEKKEVTLEFFKKLNNDHSETSRIAFTCKFLHTQFGVTVTSKEIYNWLQDTGKKATKRR